MNSNNNSAVNSTSVYPVAIYSNADLNKIQILEENRKKSGVYRWVNNLNHKTYIGSSRNLTERFLDYYQTKILLKNKTPIHLALLKYGYSNFQLEILEYCEKKEAILREQYFFDLLKPEYNILKTAGSSLGFKHSEKTIKFMKTLHLLDDEIRKKRSLARLGTKHSDKTRAILSAATTASIGISVIVKNININEETEYINLTEAAKAINVSRTAVKKALDTGKVLKKTYNVTKK